MNEKQQGTTGHDYLVQQAAKNIPKILEEPILKILLENSVLTKTQLETLLIDLVIEDNNRIRLSYQDKALYRSRRRGKPRGVSRGAYNRTLKQARRNTTKCLHTMLLLAYLGLFDFAIFRPFEEIATRIGDFRLVREILAGKSDISNEEFESYRTAEETIVAALEKLMSPLTLKSQYKGSLKD
ncbi:MAG: hypothetical protein ACW99U_01285 [Candidatus Thorarchaeota archaeon]